jgi:hypothetical protein
VFVVDRPLLGRARREVDMIERVQIAMTRADGLTGALLRYALLERMAGTSERCEVTVLAFGMGDRDIRLVVEGEATRITNLVRGLKVGTTRSAVRLGVDLTWTPASREPVLVDELERSVAWAHRAPVDAGASGPLASPWSSHRDLMGYRFAEFYQPGVLEGRVSPLAVHELAGGVGVPAGWPPRSRQRESLSLLLRIAAGVLGVLPADRRCFRLFAT